MGRLKTVTRDPDCSGTTGACWPLRLLLLTGHPECRASGTIVNRCGCTFTVPRVSSLLQQCVPGARAALDRIIPQLPQSPGAPLQTHLGWSAGVLPPPGSKPPCTRRHGGRRSCSVGRRTRDRGRMRTRCATPRSSAVRKQAICQQEQQQQPQTQQPQQEQQQKPQQPQQQPQPPQPQPQQQQPVAVGAVLALERHGVTESRASAAAAEPSPERTCRTARFRRRRRGRIHGARDACGSGGRPWGGRRAMAVGGHGAARSRA